MRYCAGRPISVEILPFLQSKKMNTKEQLTLIFPKIKYKATVFIAFIIILLYQLL